ncbi:MAG: hypothetical protein BM563_09220 [Bacteroidetes bacterium MedPE-SWsnd-G1]|nr:MAG: hypothetical protein BM563_09220 [Bacteroidetes bacterium MedPE-SWsnd-G1]
MKTITLRLLLILSLTFSFYSCTSDEDGIYLDETSSKFNDINLSYTQMEFEILNLVNEHRKSVGLNPLNTINLVSKEAISHTDYMISVGTVSHDNFSDRHQKLVKGVAAKKVGENVAYGYRSAKAVVNAWINSDGHRMNIENENFTDFGISTKQDAEGRNYFTHIFIKR